MPQLISKLQHNTYEKGEFSDEQPRDLNETIQLIKDFPWDLERPLTDIQLTGPSVTIQDTELNYLKLGLYFGGKFCVYYLDKDNHLYEYQADDIESVNNMVLDFFKNNLNVKLFEKPFFSIGKRQHFETNKFEYLMETSLFYLYLTFGIIVVILFGSYVIIMSVLGVSLSFYPLLIASFPGLILLYLVYTTFKNKDRFSYLQISKGKNKFLYGEDEQHINEYDKKNIEEILCFESILPSNRYGGRSLRKFKIIFNDKQSIEFTSSLIPTDVFFDKFSSDLNIPIAYKWKGLY